jgi:fructose-1,6-bisphosphatase II
VGPELRGKLDLNSTLKENIKVAAAILGLPISELTIVVLNRERHRKIINEIREIGARIKLIGDGDIAGAIATSMPESGVNMYVGIGGSPEAILAAAALRTLGGEMQLKIWPRDEEERKKINLEEWDLDKTYLTEELVGGEHVIFAATGVTDGDFLKGVKYIKGKAITESIVMRTSSETVRRITTYHDLKKKKIRIKSLDGDEKLININKVDDERTSILKNKLFR